MAKRYIAVAALVAALVMAGGTWLIQAIPGVIPEKRSKQLLDEWFAQNLAATVEAGYVTPMFYPGLGLQARGLVLCFAGGAQPGDDCFRADAVKLVADADLLLRQRRLKVNEVIVVRPKLTLTLEPSGKFNVVRWLKDAPIRRKLEAAKPKKPQAPDGLLEWRLRELTREFKVHVDSGLPGLLKLGKIELKDAEIRLIDNRDQKKLLLAPVTLADINLSFTGARGPEPAHFSLSLPLLQGYDRAPSPFTLGGKLEAPAPNELKLVSITGAWDGLTIHDLSGTLKLASPASFDATADATVSFPAVHSVATWKPVAFSKTMPDMEGQGSGRVRVRVWGPAPERVAKVHYQGEVAVEVARWWSGRVIAPIEDVHLKIALEDGAIRLPESTLIVGGQRIAGHGSMTEAKDPRFTLSVRADTIDFQKFFHPRKTPYQPGQPMLQMKTLWGGEAEIGEGFYKKIRIQDAKGKWDVTNQRLVTFPELSLKSCGGTYLESGRTYMDFNDPSVYKLFFDGQLRGVDFTAFTDQLFNTTTFLHGAADADGAIFFRFANKAFDKRSIQGDLALTVRDGYFTGFNVTGKMLQLFKLEVPDQYRDMKFKTMTGHAHFERGVASTNDLMVETPQLRAEAKGWIDFASHQCDLKIKISFLTPLTHFIRELPLVGAVLGPAGDAVNAIHVRAHGDWEKLDYAPLPPDDFAEPPAPPAP